MNTQPDRAAPAAELAADEWDFDKYEPPSPRDCFLAGYAAALRRPEWQPIATAPKDDYILLGYANSHSEEGRWMDDSSRNHWGETGWFSSDADVLCDHPSRPSHWMPLPLPPAALQPEGAK